MTIKRRTFLIGSVSGITLLAVTACAPTPPRPTPTASPTPSEIPQPLTFLRSSWSEDPFARGAFSYQAVGSTPEHRTAMSAPIDARLFFAGEATSTVSAGTVYGAKTSGERAAAEVMEAGTPGERVAVIGAGIAGATAARLLADEGYDVVVVEGRDRAGGRIHTVEDNDWPFPMELGAAWIRDPGSSAIVTDLARLDVSVVPVTLDEEARGPSGESVDVGQIGRDAVAQAIAWAADQAEDLSLAAALTRSGADEVASDRTETGISDEDRLENFLATEIVAEQGTEPDEISAWYAAESLDPGGENARLVLGGYRSLVTEALDGLDVLASSTVVSIESSTDGVSLRLARGESLSADRVLVTVPLGVLQAGTIEFEPPLPFAHRTAIAALGMGHQDKVVLRFEKPFWSTEAVVWTTIGSDYDFTLWFNLEPVTGEPILVGVVGGEVARRLSDYSDLEVLESALQSLTPFSDPAAIQPG